jgi:hypothetical protein
LFTDTSTVAEERQKSAHDCTHARLPHRIVVCDRQHARREDAEAFVRKRFLKTHGAHIATFMPSLLALTAAEGELGAVAGFRGAAEEPLFLERYLPASIEQTLAAQTSVKIRREEIVEVGNFAALDSRRARILMSFMPAFFLERSARWIVFTATSSIRGLLAALGGRCLELASAQSACAAGGADEWGRYYCRDPRVMAGFLPSARRIPTLWRTHDGD